MKWKEFKKQVEDAGVTDDITFALIETVGEGELYITVEKDRMLFWVE